MACHILGGGLQSNLPVVWASIKLILSPPEARRQHKRNCASSKHVFFSLRCSWTCTTLVLLRLRKHTGIAQKHTIGLISLLSDFNNLQIFDQEKNYLLTNEIKEIYKQVWSYRHSMYRHTDAILVICME